jgi:hypothetical protein
VSDCFARRKIYLTKVSRQFLASNGFNVSVVFHLNPVFDNDGVWFYASADFKLCTQEMM